MFRVYLRSCHVPGVFEKLPCSGIYLNIYYKMQASLVYVNVSFGVPWESELFK